jgi:uncharacterized protein (DUF362 family)
MPEHPTHPRWALTAEERDGELQDEVRRSGARVVLDDGEPATAIAAGIESLLAQVPSDRPVLVKPSVAGGRPATHEISPWLLSTVLAVVRRIRPGQEVVVGDGPAYRRFDDEAQRLGWVGEIRRAGAACIDLNEAERRWVDGWPVAAVFVDAAAVISLAKAKTHRRFGVSLSRKSLLGALSGRELGLPKLQGRHIAVPFILSSLECASPPAFSVIDGVRGIEGGGPMRGRPTSSTFWVVGRSYLGPDSLAAAQMGFDPVLVPALLAPSPGSTAGAADPLFWQRTRLSRVDYRPPLRYAFLFRSLGLASKVRNRVFAKLLHGVRECWPNPSSDA